MRLRLSFRTPSAFRSVSRLRVRRSSGASAATPTGSWSAAAVYGDLADLTNGTRYRAEEEQVSLYQMVQVNMHCNVCAHPYCARHGRPGVAFGIDSLNIYD